MAYANLLKCESFKSGCVNMWKFKKTSIKGGNYRNVIISQKDLGLALVIGLKTLYNTCFRNLSSIDSHV